MKHPNRKVEMKNRQRAKANLMSCFNFWLGKKNQYWKDEPIKFITRPRSNGKVQIWKMIEKWRQDGQH